MKEQPTTELLDILNNIDKKDMSAYIKEFAATASHLGFLAEHICLPWYIIQILCI